jgi:hypothetical protein
LAVTLREQVLESALALSPEDQAFVLHQLEQRLSSGGFVSPEIAAAWNEEIGRRILAYDRGEIDAEDADVVMRRMREYLSARRAGKAKS